MKKKMCCGAACDMKKCLTDYAYFEAYYMDYPAEELAPNPACIPNPVVQPGFEKYESACVKPDNPQLFYYTSKDPSVKGPVTMSYDATYNKFKGEIPAIDNLEGGDTITYFIMATDSNGNTAAMVPDSTEAPCPSISLWDDEKDTPKSYTCDIAGNYELCSKNKIGKPVCGRNFTVNDPAGDTCGKPDSNGNISIVTGQNHLDLIGLSAGAGTGFSGVPGEKVVCALAGLNGSPPSQESGPISAYILTILNPDMPDSNPNDTYMPNSFFMSYYPETEGIDPNLVRVLWDGECVTDQITPDVLSCKLIVGGYSENKMKIGFDKNTIKFISLNKVSPSKTLIGNYSKTVILSMQTGQIMISGAVPFWVTDTMPALRLYDFNKTIMMEYPPPDFTLPSVEATICEAENPGISNLCPKSAAKPAEGNRCILKILPPVDRTIEEKYKIYHSLSDDPATAVYEPSLDIVEDWSSPSFTKTFTVPADQLDGKKHYFFITSLRKGGKHETPLRNAEKTICQVEDWTPPAQPAGFACSTPDGEDNVCRCSWTRDAADSTLSAYALSR
ncbi:MAG TPA: hypothetical protein PLQ76_08250, partial [bacterium]|nr:hypothetical protein [bacterium]